MIAVLLGVIQLLEIAIVVRVLWSYVDRSPYLDSAPKRLLWMLTEPLLAPVRDRIGSLGPWGMFDLSPIVVIVVLRIIDQAIRQSMY